MGKLSKLIGDEVKQILDMSDAARMQRAKDMGFNNPTLYHGTSTFKSGGDLFSEFEKFEGQDMTRSVSRSPVGKLGISLAEQPKVAEDFAIQASPEGGSGATMMPVKFRHDKIASITLTGDETNDEVYGTVVDAWKQGFDAIQFKNYTTPAGTKGSFVLVKNPNQIRSVNAAFDPAKKESSNILAGALPVGAIGAASMLSPNDSYAQTINNKQAMPSPDDVGSIKAPVHPRAAQMAEYFDKYNRAIEGTPLGMVLPEAPADWANKLAYDGKTRIKDRIIAALGML